MHSFLNNIAQVYAADPDLRTYTFVFPNVRSKRYFAKCLESHGVNAHDADNMCITLTQLTELGSGMRRASSERLTFLLYKAYRRVCATNSIVPQEFDRFRFWGQRILQDFNDVDNYMARADEVFDNTRKFKEIQALYLSDAQKRIIELYWGDDPYWRGIAAGAKAEEFPLWNHINPRGKAGETYTQLWAILAPIYQSFRELLKEHNECYPGMAAKAVAETLMRGERIKPFNPRLFVFIGFNRLSTAETIIFEQLDELGKAHFYWDYDPALMAHLGANPANRFIGRYVERFTACKDDVEPPVRPALHRVDVVGVPSAVGQAKVMAQLLEREESAVVLPDEEMLLPVVASIPDKFSTINVTMGYPMRFSALSQLFAQLVSLQLRTMENHDGDTLIFRDDVRAIITNPLVQAAFNENCRRADDYMRRESLFNLPATHLSAPAFGPLAILMRPLGPDPSVDEMAAYVADVLALAADSGLVKGIDAKCCEVIAKMTEQIVTLAEECGVELKKQTFFNLIERTLFQRTMPLEGEKFDALQVMGVLETRAMGFPSVVMLSMTDSIFPGRDSSPSFIPETLRHAYGLPTRDHRDVDSAYHFYHILSAAEHLTLIYDARTGGLASGEMSRYIHQLRHLGFPNVEVNVHLAAFESGLATKPSTLLAPDVELPKTDRIMEKLLRYCDPDKLTSHSLSASALKEYIHCPAEFYFNRVERVCPYDEDSESLNPAEYGSVIHEVADRVYRHFKEHHGGIITAEMLTELLDGGHDDLLNRELTRAINLCRNHFPAEIDGKENPALYTAEIVGEAAVYRPVFLTALRRLFSIDRRSTPFEIVGTEIEETFSWPVSDSMQVNFTMKIDRIDRITEPDGRQILRVVDYKTGSDATKCKSVDQLFEFCSARHPQAIFQLFTYCSAYVHRHGVDPAMLRPQIFTLKDPELTEYPLITCGDMEVTDFSALYPDFSQKLGDLFAGLFDASEPFVRSSDENTCKFCKVYSFCHNETKPRK